VEALADASADVLVQVVALDVQDSQNGECELGGEVVGEVVLLVRSVGQKREIEVEEEA